MSADDVALEQMLAAVPDVEGIVASLFAPRPGLRPGPPGGGRPRTEIRFEAVEYRYPGAGAPALSWASTSACTPGAPWPSWV